MLSSSIVSSRLSSFASGFTSIGFAILISLVLAADRRGHPRQPEYTRLAEMVRKLTLC
jgi:hypothetical protein